MNLIDKISAKYAEKERGYIDIEEWGDEDAPLRIYFRPMTMKDLSELSKKYKGLEDPSAVVEILIRKAEDVDGKKMFTLEDKPKLLRLPDTNVIGRIAGAIAGAETVEEQGKN